MKKTLPISFRLEAIDKKALDEAAEEDARSLSSLLTLIVRQWLTERNSSKPKEKIS